MAANDYSQYNRPGAVEEGKMPTYQLEPWPEKGDPCPDHWFDAGRRRRIREFRKILPA